MQYRKEPCRNFQRGFCQYGERCKFLHVTPQKQQQSRSANSNPFGTNNEQQQKPNPFGSQSRGANDFGNRQGQYKPFENKWSRFSPINNGGGGAPSSKQHENQTQAANHKCTDPDSCKQLIVEDFEHERPLWKLTCYGHRRNAPCDITGDVSYEELRAAAYEDAKGGLSLQSIVEKERSLLNSKLMEFENLLRSPCGAPSALSKKSPLPGDVGRISPADQNKVPTSVSSFSQFGASLNTGFGIRPSTPSSNPLGANNFPSGNSGFFGSQLPNQVLLNPDPSNTSGFGTSNSMSTMSNPFSTSTASQYNGQPSLQALANSFPSNTSGFSTSNLTNAMSNPFSTSTATQNNTYALGTEPPISSNWPHSTSGVAEQKTNNLQSIDSVTKESTSVDSSIWLKEKWSLGEIPEEAPPDELIW